VQSGLLLTCLVALITIEPPVGAVINHTMRVPYMCLWVAFGILLGGMIVAFSDIFVMSTCGFEWTRQRLMGTRWRMVLALIFLAYPFFSVGISTILCAFG
ncbi:hypothetical protein BC629DRAFT_1259023, partial [Irpex lacteus]